MSSQLCCTGVMGRLLSVTTSTENDLSTSCVKVNTPWRKGVTFGTPHIGIIINAVCTYYRKFSERKRFSSVQINLKEKVKRVSPNFTNRLKKTVNSKKQQSVNCDFAHREPPCFLSIQATKHWKIPQQSEHELHNMGVTLLVPLSLSGSNGTADACC